MQKKIIFQEESEGEAERVEPEAVPYAKCRWDFFLSHWSTLCWIHFVKICGVWTVWTQIEPISQISQGHKQSNAQDAVQNLRLALSERFLGASFWLDIEQVRKTMFQTKDVVLIFLDCTEMILLNISKYIQMWRHRTLRRVFFFARIQPWGECATVCRIRAMSWSFWRRASPRANSVRWSYDGLWKPIGTWSSWWKRTTDMANPIWNTWSTGSDTHFIQILRNLSNDMATNLGFAMFPHVSPMFPLCIVPGVLMIWRQSLPRMRSSPGFEIQNFDQSVWRRFFASAHRTPGGNLRLGRPPNRLCSSFEIFQFYISMASNPFPKLRFVSPVCWICSYYVSGLPHFISSVDVSLQGMLVRGEVMTELKSLTRASWFLQPCAGLPCPECLVKKVQSFVTRRCSVLDCILLFFHAYHSRFNPVHICKYLHIESPDDLCRQLNWVLCTPGSIFLFMLLHLDSIKPFLLRQGKGPNAGPLQCISTSFRSCGFLWSVQAPVCWIALLHSVDLCVQSLDYVILH